jgi:hypothetical protein
MRIFILMIRTVFLILSSSWLLQGLKAQTVDSASQFPFVSSSIVQAPDYLSLFDYSKMGDTVITEIGNTDMTGTIFHPKTGQGVCCFAMRRIRVRKGKLREVYILDSNTGLETTITYDKKGKMKKSQRVKPDTVRNAPPYR